MGSQFLKFSLFIPSRNIWSNEEYEYFCHLILSWVDSASKLRALCLD